VDRLALSRGDGYRLDVSSLEAALERGYDLVVLVNPNSPTGRHVPRSILAEALRRAPAATRVWIDETYVDYTGPRESLERDAAGSANLVVCKSMSKVYALSGVRVAYLCGPPGLVRELRAITPPWAVSLPGQVAAVTALRDPGYYAERYRQTHALRAGLVEELRARIEIEVTPSVTNFVLCHLPPDGPDAATVARRCRREGLFVRDAARISPRLGPHALRIAVKDEATNRRVTEILARALRG